MTNAILLGCMGCAMSGIGAFYFPAVIGGPIAGFFYLKPYLPTAGTTWGLAKVRIQDLFSLSIWYACPLALARQSATSEDVEWIVIPTLLILFCLAYLWYRALWLLELNQVRAFWKRTTFLCVTLPLIIVLGIIAASSTFVFLVGVVVAALPIAGLSVGIGGAAGILVHGLLAGSLRSVFGPPERLAEEPDPSSAEKLSEMPPLPGSTIVES